VSNPSCLTNVSRFDVQSHVGVSQHTEQGFQSISKLEKIFMIHDKNATETQQLMVS